ncbi:MAG: hypothetical protein JJT94_05635 [Bernardetiaceae bacterium]|nr:hypothetical protein [Bernardetiaceae bacterium]
MTQKNINQNDWIYISLLKYWRSQALVLDFETFVFEYFKKMIAQNRQTGLEFWQATRQKENDTLLELYKRLRK